MGSDIQNFYYYLLLLLFISYVHKRKENKGKRIKTNRRAESGQGDQSHRGNLSRIRLGLGLGPPSGQPHKAGPWSSNLGSLATRLGPLEPAWAPAVPLNCSLFSFSFSNKKARRGERSGRGLQAFSDLFKDFYLFIYFSLLLTLFLLFRVVTIHG